MQNQRTKIFFVLAIVFGISAAFMAHRMLDRPASTVEHAVSQTVIVIVAKADINAGIGLALTHFATVDWPVNLAPKGFFSDKKALEGRVLRHALAAGEPISEFALLPQGSAAGLVSVISNKLRAVSVKVDPVIGVAGFVHPGSRVDVLATLREYDRSSKSSTSKVILQDVPVLAIDQRMEEVTNGEPELVSVVTLEVTPQQAEQLIYSAHEGRLQLALRSPADREIAKTKGASVGDLLPRKRARHYAYTASIQLVKGTTVEVKNF